MALSFGSFTVRKSLFGILLLVAVLFLYQNLKDLNDAQYLKIQEWKKVTNEIFQSHYIRRDYLDGEAKLYEMLPFKWDYIFRVEGGSTSTDKVIKWAFEKGMLPLKLQDYKIYDDVFLEGEDGFIFVDSSEKIVFSIILDVPISGVKNTNLINIEDLCVRGQLGPHKNYYFFVKKCDDGE